MIIRFVGIQYLFNAFISHFPSYILHCKTAMHCYQEISILEHMVLDQIWIPLSHHLFHGLLQLCIFFFFNTVEHKGKQLEAETEVILLININSWTSLLLVVNKQNNKEVKYPPVFNSRKEALLYACLSLVHLKYFKLQPHLYLLGAVLQSHSYSFAKPCLVSPLILKSFKNL